MRFESNSIVRYINRDNRDLLYKLDKNGRDVFYIGEVKVENFFRKEGHKLDISHEKETFEQMMIRNSQMTAFYRHTQILKAPNKYFKKEEEADLCRNDMVTIVKKEFRREGFRVHLSFNPFEWYLAEKFVNDEINIEQLGDKRAL